MKFTIAVLPGDGIGPEVIDGAVRVLERVGHRFGHAFDLKYGSVGGDAIDWHGTPLPQETLDICLGGDAILFGAVGGPKWDDPRAPARPEDGLLAIRKKLGLFANLRPVKIYPAIINSSPVKPQVLRGVDIMAVRELTGGLYFARPKKMWRTSQGRIGVDTLRYTEREVRRILRLAFELARGRRRHVTSVDKANVLASSRLWREVADELARGYADVQLEHMLVDSAAMQLISNPSRFDVLVAENTFGDILTDEASVLAGSMGMLPSASLAGLPGRPRRRRVVSLYEPIHGSAPDIAGKGVANPIGAIVSMAMMLRLSLGLDDGAVAVERAVERALEDGYRTPDIAGDGEETVKTSQMAEAIADRV